MRPAGLAFAAALLGGACGRPSAPPPRSDAAAPAPWTAGACDADGHGWCVAYPRPTGTKLNRLWGSGPRDVWAVGEVGTILHYDGERWTRFPSGTRDSLVAISGRGPGDAWAIGKNRTLLRLSGGAWKTVEMPKLENEEELADLLVLPNGEAWIVGGMVQRSGAAGGHCQPLRRGSLRWSRLALRRGGQLRPARTRVGPRAERRLGRRRRRRALERAHPDQEPEGEAGRDCRAPRARERMAACDRVGQRRRGRARRSAAAEGRAGERARLLGLRSGRRLGDRRAGRADALRR